MSNASPSTNTQTRSMHSSSLQYGVDIQMHKTIIRAYNFIPRVQWLLMGRLLKH